MRVSIQDKIPLPYKFILNTLIMLWPYDSLARHSSKGYNQGCRLQTTISICVDGVDHGDNISLNPQSRR